jgi:type IV secretory pathway ATPase VirB11/archaellum biosynthesis ATPase
VCTPIRDVLQVPLPDVVAMQTRQASLEGTGEITLRQLVKEALRMRPSRIIVGEVRQQEALDLLIALNSGLAGSRVTCDEPWVRCLACCSDSAWSLPLVACRSCGDPD